MAAPLLVLVMAAIQWQAGTYPVGTFKPFHVWFMVNGPYFLALLHYLDRSAEQALKACRPSLILSEGDYEDLRFRLINIPARPTFWTSLVTSVVIIGLMATAGVQQLTLFGFSTKPVSYIFEVFMFACLWWIIGALFYQLIHQLRLISRIYSQHTRINLFQLAPLYSFSGVTACLAIALTFQNFLWMVTASPANGDYSGIGVTGIVVGFIFLVMALIVFIMPLWGLHRQLMAKKHHALSQNGQCIEMANVALHREIDTGILENATRLKDSLAGLEIEHNLLQRIPTWPWQPDTLRGLVTALLVPIVIFLIQFFLGSWLNH